MGNSAIKPLRIDQAHVPFDHWQDLSRGSIAFQTLISGDVTPTDSLVCGIAMMRAGDTFALHSHPQAEVYFGLDGTGEVMVDGAPHLLAPGVALFIPGGAVHGVPVARSTLRWFYTFAADSFADIAYAFRP
ncbi:MAG: cupin domain-containing protein [Cypionkella sp.]|nr:cupin domain-containing protein [Cypionkella sp.]